MKPGVIRALAICVFRRDGRILVFEGYDVVKGQVFYRPLGGSVEFGEYSRDWKPLPFFQEPAAPPLYPDGLLSLLLGAD